MYINLFVLGGHVCICLCEYVLCLNYYVFTVAAHVANKVVYIVNGF